MLRARATTRPLLIAATLAAASLLGACGDDGTASTDPDASVGNDGGGGADGNPAIDAGAACPRSPGAADRSRFVVISHPFAVDQGTYEVLALDAAGALTTTGKTFVMRRAFDGRIHFTPDGEIGVVAHDDGTLGVFALDATGTALVLHEAYDPGGDFYATGELVVSADGQTLFVMNSQWRDNGGGFFAVPIGCDGSLGAPSKLVQAKLAHAPALLPDGRAVIPAKDYGTDESGTKGAYLVDWAQPANILGSVDVFGHDEAIIADSAATSDGAYVLIADNAGFYSTAERENTVAVVAVGAAGLTRTQLLSPVNDPFSIVTSPFGDRALIVSGFGDALLDVSHTAASATPFAIVGELAYSGGGPQLPGQAVMLRRGALSGLVLVSENLGVRRVRFRQGQAPLDEGRFGTGAGNPAIVGAIGVQP